MAIHGQVEPELRLGVLAHPLRLFLRGLGLFKPLLGLIEITQETKLVRSAPADSEHPCGKADFVRQAKERVRWHWFALTREIVEGSFLLCLEDAFFGDFVRPLHFLFLQSSLRD